MRSDAMKKALVVLSGGQDSTTCLFWAKQKYDEVHAVTFNYGQRHARELEAARIVGELAGVASHELIDLGKPLVGSSPLVSAATLEQYPDMYSLPGGLEKTFVPGRNALFFVIAANRAYALGCTTIVSGVCEEDYGGYPDCRREFVDAIEQAIGLGFAYDLHDEFAQFRIQTPLMHLSKAATVRLAYDLGAECWNALAFTHTAYDGQYPPLGNDHATLLRAKGFAEAGLPDPLILRAHQEGLMPLPETPNYDSARLKLTTNP
jgi:7-cyano-7-deazaguanine synthase